jgi:Resolvase, N terminal domain
VRSTPANRPSINLDLEFNSLNAQRDACEAYIKSQAHEGWRLVPDHYDDGGLSGASLDRPAMTDAEYIAEDTMTDICKIVPVFVNAAKAMLAIAGDARLQEQ